jgi:FimV-like protein
VYDAAIADAQIAAVEHDAPMAPPPSVAPPPRLGAAHFGALNLDFDLDLPPLAAQPSVALAPDELAAIARHKLNLAVESMKLGDAAGARALVSEVIASNDPTTLEKARALHAALAPL